MEKSEGRRRRKRACIIACCSVVVVLVIAIAIVAIVLRLLLKPKDVSLHVNDIKLQNFNFTFHIPTLQTDVTLIMDMNIQVYNPNRASFKYTNSTVFMFYHGEESAHTFIPAGNIPARNSVNISTTLSVDADKVAGNSHVSDDYRDGVLPVTTKSEVRGRVNVWNIYKHRMMSISNCEILLSITNQTVISYKCDSRNVF